MTHDGLKLYEKTFHASAWFVTSLINHLMYIMHLVSYAHSRRAKPNMILFILKTLAQSRPKFMDVWPKHAELKTRSQNILYLVFILVLNALLWKLIHNYWVAQSGIGGILSQGKIWTLPFHEAKPSEMEQSKFYRAIIFLPFHELKPLNICFI